MSDPTADQSSALQQLLDSGPLRHSIDPPASDFTGVTDADAWMAQLLQWQAAGIIGNLVPNDTYDTDGVRTRWRLGVNGLMMCVQNGIGAPTITALTPSTAPANADVAVEITGTRFSGGATVEIGIAYGLVPTSITPTAISVVFEAINIEYPGTLAVKVKNYDGQESNALDFVVT